MNKSVQGPETCALADGKKALALSAILDIQSLLTNPALDAVAAVCQWFTVAFSEEGNIPAMHSSALAEEEMTIRDNVRGLR